MKRKKRLRKISDLRGLFISFFTLLLRGIKMFDFQGINIIMNQDGEYLEVSEKKKKNNKKYKGD